MKKNVLAFIQLTNAAPQAMFSWLNTNTNSIVGFIFLSIQIKQHVHFISVYTSVFCFFMSGEKIHYTFFLSFTALKKKNTRQKY